MEEKVFLQIGADAVTSSKIVIGGNTYATRNVGSVRMEVIPAKRTAGIVTAAVGVFALFSTAPMFGVVLLGVGGVIAMVAKARAKLLLMAGGGESLALESTDTALVMKLHAAIVDAISAR